jgi:hypothetical protein
MNLMVVILVDFLALDLLGWLDIIDIFPDTGSNQMVLEPAVRSFLLAFGLGREGIGDLDIAVLWHFSPFSTPPMDNSHDPEIEVCTFKMKIYQKRCTFNLQMTDK